MLPFFPNIYEKLHDERNFIIYSTTYTKNPAIEWNRQIGSFLKELTIEQQQSESVSNFLLKKIGKELNNSIPAILASSGYKPMDSMLVSIANTTSYDIKDIKVHFIGCSGFDSFKKYPDAYGSPVKSGSNSESSVTIKYEAIPRVLSRSMSVAYITFYGLDASACKPIVTATYKNGQSIDAKLIDDIKAYQTELAWKDYDRDNLFNTIYKIFNGLALVFFYTQIKNLRKKQKGEST